MELNGKPISAEELLEILIADSLQNNVKYYGIEALEEQIKKYYSHNPVCMNKMLNVYNRMYKYEK